MATIQVLIEHAMLASLAGQFGAEAAQLKQAYSHLNSHVHEVVGKAWRGDDATAFLKEQENVTFKRTEGLINALQQTSDKLKERASKWQANDQALVGIFSKFGQS